MSRGQILESYLMERFEFKRIKKFFCIRNIRKWEDRSTSLNGNINKN